MTVSLSYFVGSGINSNALGYLNGISCALLVARICNRVRVDDPVQIMMQFFFTFAEWYAISMSCFEGSGIYSNAMGYWGGIVSSLSMAKTCCDNENDKDPAEVLKRFFETYAVWYAISVSCFEYITVGTMNMM